MTSPVPARQQLERVHCNGCGGDTDHDVVGKTRRGGSEAIDEYASISWMTTWTMLECRGCHLVCLRKNYWFSEDGSEHGVDEFFPPPNSRRPPPWTDQLGAEEKALLEEVYVALHAGNRRLAMMGARALVDVVLARNDGPWDRLPDGLASLRQRGLISTRDSVILNTALEVGHAASHRGHLPSYEDAELVMDIVERLLQGELIAPASVQMQARTPPRVRRRDRTQ
jgi:hypothetical protein